MFKPKIVLYKVTDAFGVLDVGEFINAVLIAYDPDTKLGLIYHPRVPGECASFEFAKLRKNQYWTSARKEMYINVYPDNKDLQTALLGANFKFKR